LVRIDVPDEPVFLSESHGLTKSIHGFLYIYGLFYNPILVFGTTFGSIQPNIKFKHDEKFFNPSVEPRQPVIDGSIR
jgi:hypothetical protein